MTEHTIPGIADAQGLVDKGGFGYAAGVIAVLVLLGVTALGFRYAWLKLREIEQTLKSNGETSGRPCHLGSAKSPEDLIRHSLFVSLDMAIISTIPTLPIKDPGRRAVFTDLLNIKFEAIRSVFKEWMRNHIHNLDEMDNERLYAELMSLIGKTIRAYQYGFEEAGIPTPVVEAFNSWHARRVQALESELETITGSTWIGGPVAKVGYFFSVLENTSGSTLLDGERVLRTLNGSITGLPYKGLIIGPCANLGGYPSRSGHE